MKKIFTLSAAVLSLATVFAQPIVKRDSLKAGLNFNLYSLANVNIADLVTPGANLSWDLSQTIPTAAGTADFQLISATPYALAYPAANFAIKFTTGATVRYSLFNLTSSIFEEVANSVGTTEPTVFSNYRTSLVFPFTFNLTNVDTYQKQGQAEKTISNSYDAYGTMIANSKTNSDVVRVVSIDDEKTSIIWWRTSPLVPLFQGSSSGFVLWELKESSNTTGISDMETNQLFHFYPNPAKNELQIINTQLISKVEIYNQVGQIQFSTKNSTIDISGLKNGIYFIKAYGEKGSVSQKFVKE